MEQNNQQNAINLIQHIKHIIDVLDTMNQNENNYKQEIPLMDLLHTSNIQQIDYSLVSQHSESIRFLAEFFATRTLQNRTNAYIKKHNLYHIFNQVIQGLKHCETTMNRLFNYIQERERQKSEIKTACMYLSLVSLKQCNIESYYQNRRSVSGTRRLKSKSKLRKSIKSNTLTRYEKNFQNKYGDSCDLSNDNAYSNGLIALQTMIDNPDIMNSTKAFIYTGFSIFLIHPFLLTSTLLHVKFFREKLRIKIPNEKVIDIFSEYLNVSQLNALMDKMKSIIQISEKASIIQVVSNQSTTNELQQQHGEPAENTQAENIQPRSTIEIRPRENTQTENIQPRSTIEIRPRENTQTNQSNLLNDYYIKELRNYIKELRKIIDNIESRILKLSPTINEESFYEKRRLEPIIVKSKELIEIIEKVKIMKRNHAIVSLKCLPYVTIGTVALQKYYDHLIEKRYTQSEFFHTKVQETIDSLNFILRYGITKKNMNEQRRKKMTIRKKNALTKARRLVQLQGNSSIEDVRLRSAIKEIYRLKLEKRNLYIEQKRKRYDTTRVEAQIKMLMIIHKKILNVNDDQNMNNNSKQHEIDNILKIIENFERIPIKVGYVK